MVRIHILCGEASVISHFVLGDILWAHHDLSIQRHSVYLSIRGKSLSTRGLWWYLNWSGPFSHTYTKSGNYISFHSPNSPASSSYSSSSSSSSSSRASNPTLNHRRSIQFAIPYRSPPASPTLAAAPPPVPPIPSFVLDGPDNSRVSQQITLTPPRPSRNPQRVAVVWHEYTSGYSAVEGAEHCVTPPSCAALHVLFCVRFSRCRDVATRYDVVHTHILYPWRCILIPILIFSISWEFQFVLATYVLVAK